MNRLTFKEPNGKWGVVGINADNKEEKAYGCICKLLAYEETGLEPAEIEELICEVSSIKQVRTVAELICSKYENLFSRLEDAEENEPAEKVRIGTIIQGYRIIGILKTHCIAERINKVGCDDFVVWRIDFDGKGVCSGKYFEFYEFAKAYFMEMTF